MLERSTSPALELREAPDRAAAAPGWLPLCPRCGDSDLQPLAVCPGAATGAEHADILALRCTSCGSLVFEAPPGGGLAEVPLHTPRWLTPRLAVEIGGWCRRVLEPTAGIVYVGSPDDPVAPLEGRLRSTQSLRRLAPGALESLSPDAADAVLLTGVLEQIALPLDTLRRIARSLPQGGRLLVVGLNLDASAFRWFGGRHWAGYDTPGQRHLLSPAALEGLARAAGLAVERSTTFPFAAGWSGSIRRLVQDWERESRLIDAVQGSSLWRGSINLFEGVQARLGRGGIRAVCWRRSQRPAP